MGGNPPETPIEDAAAEQNVILEVSGSTEDSDGNVADAEQSIDTSGTLEQGETISETEVIPRTSVMGEVRAPVSEDEEDEDEEEDESSSTESVSSELSESNISIDSDVIEEDQLPDTVLDVNDIAGNETVEAVEEVEEPSDADLSEVVEPEALESVAEEEVADQEAEEVAKKDTEEDAERLAEEAEEEHGFEDALPVYEVEVETEDEPRAEESLTEVAESLASPSNNQGEESAEIAPGETEIQEAQQAEEEGPLSSPEKEHDASEQRNKRSVSATSGDDVSSVDNEQEEDEASSENEHEEDEEEEDGDGDDNDEVKPKVKPEPVPQLKKIVISEHPEEKVYFIRRKDGTVHHGHVLQSRPTEDGADYPEEYYVHYLGLNRRLDGWVARHRISKNADDLGGIKVDMPLTSANTPSTSGCSSVPRPNRQGNKDYYLGALESNRYDYSDRKMTRYQKRRYDEVNHVQKSQAELTASMVQLEKEHEAITKIKYIDKLIFGYYEINTWYFSPFPAEYGKARTLYVCEYCLKYMKMEKSYRFHLYDCKERQPPGKQIYRNGSIAIYEVIGREQPLYCQLLSLTAKLFLDHKVLYYDMDPFLFYVLCEVDEEGSHVVGYFSKERVSMDNNNVACILVLPPHQRKGYGKLLIAFSYELSRKEGVIGSPEKPLSDLGRLSYRSYWAYTLLELMKGRCSSGHVTIKELSEASGITQDDIIYTLQSMKLIKYWIGGNVICVTLKTINELLQLPQFKRPKLTIDLEYLNWKPLSAEAAN